jgi:hypothetical protein
MDTNVTTITITDPNELKGYRECERVIKLRTRSRGRIAPPPSVLKKVTDLPAFMRGWRRKLQEHREWSLTWDQGEIK